MIEIWKPVEGYEEFYEVSDLGRVRSLPRKRTSGKVLTPAPRADARLSVSFSVPGKERVSVSVHRIVARAFLGPKPDGMFILHSDGNHLNNCAANLRFGTAKDNAGDARKHGTLVVGSKVHWAKLAEADVVKIKKLLKTGESCADIARVFNVDRTSVSLIKRGKTWKHVKL